MSHYLMKKRKKIYCLMGTLMKSNNLTFFLETINVVWKYMKVCNKYANSCTRYLQDICSWNNFSHKYVSWGQTLYTHKIFSRDYVNMYIEGQIQEFPKARGGGVGGFYLCRIYKKLFLNTQISIITLFGNFRFLKMSFGVKM